MNKLIAILYAVLILVQSFNINFEDISKFETLLAHAEFHQVTYGDSFIDFLKEHYGEGSIELENNHEEHKDLPFKDSQHILSHNNTSFTLNLVSFDIKNPIFVKPHFSFFYKELHSVFEKSSVFQPPKHA